MNRKCQLPIQDDVSVYTYTYYGFANSIIQANAYYDNCIVKFEIIYIINDNVGFGTVSENKYFKCSGDFCDGAVGLLGCF